MPASDWPAGYELTVQVNGAYYPFKTTGYNVTAREIDRSNSKYAAGFEITKPGAAKLSFTADGPYRPGEVPLVLRQEYTFIYKPYAAHVGLTFFGAVIDINHTNDVTDGPNMSIKITNTDTFDLVVA